MTGKSDDGAAGFTRRPRTASETTSGTQTRAKFLDSLDAIENFLHHAIDAGRTAFTLDSPAYACGSMVIIRIAALFETDEFDALLASTPPEVRQAIRTTRHIAAHAGYRPMNDDIFWTTLTVDLPPYLRRWRDDASG